MVTAPAATPVTVPVELPAVAISGLLLVHVPPGDTSVNATLLPAQTFDDAGEIAVGVATTVTCAVAEHPLTV